MYGYNLPWPPLRKRPERGLTNAADVTLRYSFVAYDIARRRSMEGFTGVRHVLPQALSAVFQVRCRPAQAGSGPLRVRGRTLQAVGLHGGEDSRKRLPGARHWGALAVLHAGATMDADRMTLCVQPLCGAEALRRNRPGRHGAAWMPPPRLAARRA